MKRSKRIKPLVRQAEQEMKKKAQILGDSQRRVDVEIGRLQDMQTYRVDYQQQIQDNAAAGVQADKFFQMKRFLGQLDHLIQQQHKAVHEKRHVVDMNKQAWLKSHGRHQALQKTYDRFCAEELKQEDKREQSDMDELIMRRYQGVGGRDDVTQ